MDLMEVRRSLLMQGGKKRIAVVWNNMCAPFSSSMWAIFNQSNISATYDDGIATIIHKNSVHSAFLTSIYPSNDPSVNTSSYYYVSCMIKPNYHDARYSFDFAGGYQTGPFPTLDYDVWSRLSSKAKGQRNGGGRLYVPGAQSSTAGDSEQLKSVLYVNLTKMFGEGNEPTISEFEYLCQINGIDLTTQYPINVSGTEQLWYIN